MKKVLLPLLATTFTLSIAHASGGLTLCSENYPHKVDVFCGGVKSPAPIPASSANKQACASLQGVSTLPWSAIKGLIFQGKSTATCDFKNGSVWIGSAVLTISNDNTQGTLTNVQHDATLNVEITPDIDKAAETIGVLLKPVAH